MSTIATFDTAYLEAVFAANLPEVLRQHAGLALALRHESHPVVMGFVFGADLDAFYGHRLEDLEVFAVIVVNAEVRVTRISSMLARRTIYASTVPCAVLASIPVILSTLCGIYFILYGS